MGKNYYVANINNSHSNDEILNYLLAILCFLAVVVFICNYYMDYKIDMKLIIILLIIILLGKIIL